MELTEAEIQLLSCLHKAECHALATDRASLEKQGECYDIFKENWVDAYDRLIEAKLISGDDNQFSLTPTGKPIALQYHAERPDLYWYHYQKFYPAAVASPTHSRLCEKVFGKDLSQEGQTDMESLHELLNHLDLKPDEKVLDLGCGAGVIAEYISDITNTRVTGVDYAASAITDANNRTVAKRSRLDFIQGDYSDLVLAPDSYDAVISIDTLYWDSLLEKTLSMIKTALKPGGRMGVFLNHTIKHDDPSELLNSEHSELSKVLSKLNFSFEVYEYNQALKTFWQNLQSATLELRDEFAAEGNAFIADNYLREAEVDHLPEINDGIIARYLYIIRCQ